MKKKIVSWVDKHFKAIGIVFVALSFVMIVSLTAYDLYYNQVHQCHDTSTYHWETYCQYIPVGKTFIMECHQQYVPDVVCDKP